MFKESVAGLLAYLGTYRVFGLLGLLEELGDFFEARV